MRDDAVAAIAVDHWTNDWWPYLVTLTILARHLEITSVDRVAVTASIEVGKTKTIEKADGKATFERRDERTLKLSSDTPFVIALSASSIRIREGRVVDLDEYEVLSKKTRDVYTSLALLPSDDVPGTDELDVMRRLRYV